MRRFLFIFLIVRQIHYFIIWLNWDEKSQLLDLNKLAQINVSKNDNLYNKFLQTTSFL